MLLEDDSVLEESVGCDGDWTGIFCISCGTLGFERCAGVGGNGLDEMCSSAFESTGPLRSTMGGVELHLISGEEGTASGAGVGGHSSGSGEVCLSGDRFSHEDGLDEDRSNALRWVLMLTEETILIIFSPGGSTRRAALLISLHVAEMTEDVPYQESVFYSKPPNRSSCGHNEGVRSFCGSGPFTRQATLMEHDGRHLLAKPFDILPTALQLWWWSQVRSHMHRCLLCLVHQR